MREEVSDERVFLVMGREIGNVPRDRIAEVELPPLDELHRAQIDHRLGDRGQEKHTVGSNRLGIRLGTLAAEELGGHNLAAPADENRAAGNGRLSARGPAGDQIVSHLQPRRIQSNLVRLGVGKSIRHERYFPFAMLLNRNTPPLTVVK